MSLLSVTPWVDSGEWNHVRQLVLNRDTSVLQHFAVWRSRVNRLPTGVETTATLVQALSSGDNDLALSTAINRFLNHISHLGMKIWGVGKLHEAAERLQVPEWLVEVRHDSTHGTMPSLNILRAGHELCYAWICTNYWSPERPVRPVADSPEDPDQVVKNLLECHMYLKIYLIWGTEKVRDLKDQQELYSHLRKLWPGYLAERAGEEFDTMSLKLALGMVKTEILNIEPDCRNLASILASEDLLVPEADFLESLVGDHESDEEHVEIPTDLIKIWEDFIVRIDEKVGTKVLLDHLVMKILNDDVSEEVKEYTAAWIVVLTEALLGRSEALPQLARNHGLTGADVERWLAGSWPPSRLLGQLLPCFCELAGLQVSHLAQLRSLLAIAAGDTLQEGRRREQQSKQEGDADTDKDCDIFTVASLRQMAGGDSALPAPSAWQLVAMPSNTDSLQPEDWSSLWLPETTSWKPSTASGRDSLQGSAIASPPPLFTVEQVIWPGPPVGSIRLEKEKDSMAVPAFYRNETRGVYTRGGGGGRGRRSASHLSSPASPYSRKRPKRD